MFTEWELQDVFKTGEDTPTFQPTATLKEDDIDPDDVRPYTQFGKLAELGDAFPFDSQVNKAVFSWDEIVSHPLEKAVPSDGVVTEKSGKQTWRYHYQNGKCTKMELEDPQLEGGRMCFDGEGNELAA